MLIRKFKSSFILIDSEGWRVTLLLNSLLLHRFTPYITGHIWGCVLHMFMLYTDRLLCFENQITTWYGDAVKWQAEIQSSLVY
jgi:hypothetical protein